MKVFGDRHRMLLLAALAGCMAMPLVASAEDKIYPPGTDCANQATIAERLLCGRQEFRRQHGASIEQPTVPSTPQDDGQVFPETPTAPMEIRPAPEQQNLFPRTSSPTH